MTPFEHLKSIAPEFVEDWQRCRFLYPSQKEFESWLVSLASKSRHQSVDPFGLRDRERNRMHLANQRLAQQLLEQRKYAIPLAIQAISLHL
jgi:hypothetical protein